MAVCVGQAAADPVRDAALTQIKQLNRDAMSAFDELEFDTAKSKLEEALGVARDTGISRGPDLAKTHMNLAVVYGSGFNDRANAAKHFAEAVKADPTAKLDPMRATPVLEELFNGAKEAAGPVTPPAAAAGLRHEPLDEAPAGAPVQIYARVGAGSEVETLMLFYRRIGEAEYRTVEMRQGEPGVYLGTIPADYVVQGRNIHYYIEALGPGGVTVENSGAPTSPHVISVTAGAGGVTPPGGGAEPQKKRKVVSIALMVGTGGGFVYGGKTENAANSIESDPNCEAKLATGAVASCPGPGGALAPFHIAPEVSYHITDKWQVALLGRLQVVNALTGGLGWASRVSVLGVLRAKRFFGDGPLRFNVGAGAGGGQIRHRIKAQMGWDSRVAQYVAFNVSGGLQYMFTDYLGAVVDVTGLILVPDFAAHADLNLGLVLTL